MYRRNPARAQQFALADAGELQQFRRVDRTPADDHLARRLRLPGNAVDGVAHADATLAFEDQRFRHRALLDDQVRPSTHGIEIADRRTLALAARDRDLRDADTFLSLPIQVWIERQADPAGGLDDLLQQRHFIPRRIGHPQQPIAAAKLVRTAVVAFHPAEDRQHVLIAPAAVAELGPVVVILRLAAHIYHAVDRARSAHHLAARY